MGGLQVVEESPPSFSNRNTLDQQIIPHESCLAMRHEAVQIAAVGSAVSRMLEKRRRPQNAREKLRLPH